MSEQRNNRHFKACVNSISMLTYGLYLARPVAATCLPRPVCMNGLACSCIIFDLAMKCPLESKPPPGEPTASWGYVPTASWGYVPTARGMFNDPPQNSFRDPLRKCTKINNGCGVTACRVQWQNHTPGVREEMLACSKIEPRFQVGVGINITCGACEGQFGPNQQNGTPTATR